MDNNQQTAEGGVTQPSTAKAVTEQAGPEVALASSPTSDLGVNNAGTMNVQTPFTGKDVSMTTGQTWGGPIATTETGADA